MENRSPRESSLELVVNYLPRLFEVMLLAFQDIAVTRMLNGTFFLETMRSSNSSLSLGMQMMQKSKQLLRSCKKSWRAPMPQRALDLAENLSEPRKA